jgi:LPPG:FO 2-phospho-L-lactate transferase
MNIAPSEALNSRSGTSHYLALTGGVGGAKLALGLTRLLPPEQLSFAVNVGDDFEHMGLHICPDLDTLLYTLAGASNPETGWGRRDESWTFMTAVRALGGPDWFNLGDKDLAVHVQRTRDLRDGATLTAAMAALAEGFGVRYALLPVSDDPVRTLVDTDEGELPFQHYFVRRRCEPAVRGIRFDGAQQARLNPAIAARLDDPALAGVIICPSNPYLSVDPLLAVPGLRDRLAQLNRPVVAVSPIVAGQALKGPTAKLMQELAVPATADAVAAHYQGIASAFVLDTQDAGLTDAVATLGLHPSVAQSVMVSLQDRVDLAQHVLDVIHELQGA